MRHYVFIYFNPLLCFLLANQVCVLNEIKITIYHGKSLFWRGGRDACVLHK